MRRESKRLEREYRVESTTAAKRGEVSRSASSSKVAASTAIVTVYNKEIRGMLKKEVDAVLVYDRVGD